MKISTLKTLALMAAFVLSACQGLPPEPSLTTEPSAAAVSPKARATARVPTFTPILPTPPPPAQPLTAQTIGTAQSEALPLNSLSWPVELLWPSNDQVIMPLQEKLVHVQLSPLAMGSAEPQGLTGTPVTYAPDGSSLVAAQEDLSLQIWDRASGKTTPLGISPSLAVNYSADGKYLAAAAAGRWEVTLLELPSLKPLKVLTGFQTAAPVYWALVAPGGQTVVWISRATAQIQDAAGGQLSPAIGYPDFIQNFVFSLDGKMAAVAAGGQLDVMKIPEPGRTAQPKTLLIVSERSEMVQTAAFSPDGTMLAAAQGGKIRIWETAKWTEVPGLENGGDRVRLLSFSPDGSRLVSVDDQNLLRVWQVVR